MCRYCVPVLSGHGCGVLGWMSSLPPWWRGVLGALPASAEFLRRLDLAGIIDELCPVRDVAHVTHGQVIEVLVANRLSAPAPLVQVGDWAREWAVEEVFGIEAELLNDDRLGRALDAIAPRVEQIIGTVGAHSTLRQIVITQVSGLRRLML